MSKPIHQLQTACFPLGHRCVPFRAAMHWGLGSPEMHPGRSFGGLRKLSHSISARSLSRAIGMEPIALTCYREQD
jgi:hypothetical protein